LDDPHQVAQHPLANQKATATSSTVTTPHLVVDVMRETLIYRYFSVMYADLLLRVHNIQSAALTYSSVRVSGALSRSATIIDSASATILVCDPLVTPPMPT